MKMRTKLKMVTAVLVLSGSAALAAVTTDQVVSQFQADGYSWIEVKKGPTQIKVEAVKGTEKVEVVIDTETGAVIDREVEVASAREQARTGVEVSERSRDFESRDEGDDEGDDGASDDDGSDHDSGDDHGDDHDDDGGDDDHGGGGSGDGAGSDDHGGDDD